MEGRMPGLPLPKRVVGVVESNPGVSDRVAAVMADFQSLGVMLRGLPGTDLAADF